MLKLKTCKFCGTTTPRFSFSEHKKVCCLNPKNKKCKLCANAKEFRNNTYKCSITGRITSCADTCKSWKKRDK